MFLSKTECKLFLTFLIIYFFFVQWYGWNEQSHFSLTRAIAEEEKFEIDSFYNQTGDRSHYNNHYYSDKTPGLSFFTVPIYATWRFLYYNFFPLSFIQKYSGNNKFVSQSEGDVFIVSYLDPGFFVFTSMILVTIFTSSLFSSLTAILIYKISRYFTKNERHRILVTVVYAFGTLAFVNALHFMSHAMGTFFAFLSFFLLFKSKKEMPKKELFILAGIAVGFGIVVEYSIVLIAIMLLVYSFTIDKHKSLIFLSALLVGIVPLLLYNFFILGNPFDMTSSHIDRQIYRTANPETGLFFSSGDVEYQEKIIRSSFFPIEDLLKHFHFIPNPNPYIILRLLVYPYRGLFFYSPILLLSIISMILMLREYRVEMILILSILFLFLCFLSMRSNWWGGYCFGNRHLMPIVPFLTLPMIYTFNKIGLKLVLPLVFLSIFINSLGLQPAEDDMYDWNFMRPMYSNELNSFQILGNPLLTHYLPLFLTNGPRSWVFENLVNGQISVDIRVNPISKGANFPFSAFHVPFLCLIPIFLILVFVWGEEVINFVKKSFKE
ncbi:MAG: phospholipid carrier-dependent glycosyltransferase [Candidatus Aenigmarchaeota archaeon]|nr:phospholipid carrier-dependent glycosyltransferase [Candidatus Aenigmarchaeota archaeon]